MSESVSSNDELCEMRAHQAALRDELVKTNAIYQTLSERIHKIELSAFDCAKLYGEETTAMAADPSAESKLEEFVEVLSGSIVELASRIPYSEDGIRAKLVDFIAELQKVVVTGPKSWTGEQLRCYSDQKLWTDLPMYWTWCSEERVSFEPHDPTLTLHETQRWKNLSAFWAGSLRCPELGQPRYGRSACSDAFGPYEPGEEVGNHTFLVQVACLWLIYSDGHMGAHMLGTSNHLDHKAWDKWKQGLQDFRDMDDEDETKALIDKALAEMEKAEQRWLS